MNISSILLFVLLSFDFTQSSSKLSINQVIELINSSKKIILLVGAGVSVSCGIPDFRSPGGLYDTLSKKGFTNPTDIFDLDVFRKNPEVFYSNAGSLLPSNYRPGPSHRFFMALSRRNKLLRIYTQNIDTLENKAGVPRNKIVYCHGSMEKYTCLRCGRERLASEIEPFIIKKEVPYCEECLVREREGKENNAGNDEWALPLPVFKPNVVFFGERLPTEYYRKKMTDFDQADLLIVTGTSLQVGPVNMLIHDPRRGVPQVLVNRESVGPADHFDAYLLGDSDDVFSYMAQKLGYNLSFSSSSSLSSSSSSSSSGADDGAAGNRSRRKASESDVMMRLPMVDLRGGVDGVGHGEVVDGEYAVQWAGKKTTTVRKAVVRPSPLSSSDL